MADTKDKSEGKVGIGRLRLAGGWWGWVALRGPDGSELAESDWRQCLAEPDKLLEKPSDTLKSDGRNAVIVRQLGIGDRDFSVVVKSQRPGDGSRDLVRSLLGTKAMRNFRMAMRLHSAGIATSYPLAALRRKKGPRTIHSIFISEYVSDSCNLYDFLRERSGGFGRYDAESCRRLAIQIGRLFARLHTEGLWHRDAKASNFLVRWQGGAEEAESSGRCEVFLVDMDGIKRYYLGGRRRQFRSLAKLASTVLCHGVINRTDYLRTFMAYSKMLGLDRAVARGIYREVSGMATAMRLLTMANAAIEGRGIIIEGN